MVSYGETAVSLPRCAVLLSISTLDSRLSIFDFEFRLSTFDLRPSTLDWHPLMNPPIRRGTQRIWAAPLKSSSNFVARDQNPPAGWVAHRVFSAKPGEKLCLRCRGGRCRARFMTPGTVRFATLAPNAILARQFDGRASGAGVSRTGVWLGSCLPFYDGRGLTKRAGREQRGVNDVLILRASAVGTSPRSRARLRLGRSTRPGWDSDPQQAQSRG
jgi:hypothetical protein